MNASVLVAGETLVDFLPDRPGPLSAVGQFERRPGGAPANVAVALARLEHDPALWTRVGNDPFGRYLVDVLADHGLPDDYVEVDHDAQTTLAFVTHDESGDRTFSFYRDGTADTRLEPGTVGDDTLDSLEWVHTGGVTLSSGRSREATLGLLERAQVLGCTTSFDPNHRPELWADRETFERIGRRALAHTDVCKATVEELELLGCAGETPEAVARDALDCGPHTVFLTRGSEGAMVVTDTTASMPEAVFEHPGFEADVVDTTGAGDAFVAGLVASLREGRGLEETLAFASAVAAQTTTEPGAMTALPTRDDVQEWLDAAGS
ncbi:carbohydrate kinase family protein [Natronosalvus rutilus]|uniref:Carbohydrate kinase n=1 Tax=Natronosalvus rutilus TaxID=2953753 RepID=A0A9E7N8H7_9EURY|nr:carbohydrate kinase [Natronosalvus rutilus]UTF53385.1 carbohydrate kinase [Natronosalvus rutilus]